MDIYNNKVYTSFNLNENNKSHIKMVFMPLLFMGPNPPYTDAKLSLAQIRSNRIWEILDKEQEEIDFNENFLKSIGMVYEYYYDEHGTHNTTPRSLNGMPLFMSCRFVNIEDTPKIFEYLEKYTSLREKIDNF